MFDDVIHRGQHEQGKHRGDGESSHDDSRDPALHVAADAKRRRNIAPL
jgi:hypothetical protein